MAMVTAEALKVSWGQEPEGVPVGASLFRECSGPHLEAPGFVQPGDVLRAPQGPPGHGHSVAPAM